MKIKPLLKDIYDFIPLKRGIAGTFVVVLVLFVLGFTFLKVKEFVLNRIVSKSEYTQTLKNIEKNQKITDSLFVEIRKRDEVIAGLKTKQTQLEATKIKNRNTLKNAKGNIAVLDSIADGIL